MNFGLALTLKQALSEYEPGWINLGKFNVAIGKKKSSALNRLNNFMLCMMLNLVATHIFL